MKQKRIMFLLTAAGVLLANIPLMPAIMPATFLTAYAEEETTSGTCGENMTWALKDGVTSIGQWAFYG
jgi:Na+/alanine symporter